MPNAYGVVEISVNELAKKREAGDEFVLLDVREPHEFEVANLGAGVETAPLSRLAREGLTALPESVSGDVSAEIIIMCHHGGRSAQVTKWLADQGWTNVINLDGGIHAYSLMIDPNIPTY